MSVLLLRGTGLLLEPKDHIKQRVFFSPDLGDAAALTFAVDFNEVVDKSEERFRPYRGSAHGQSWIGG